MDLAEKIHEKQEELEDDLLKKNTAIIHSLKINDVPSYKKHLKEYTELCLLYEAELLKLDTLDIM